MPSNYKIPPMYTDPNWSKKSRVAAHPFVETSRPDRAAVRTYLRSLDARWRGGWSWQWPMIIGGPKNSGKTLLLSQLVVSSLLSYKPPWHLLYLDLQGRFRPLTLFNQLKARVGVKRAQQHLHRIDKFRILCGMDLCPLIDHLIIFRPDLALWAIDGWELFHSPRGFHTACQRLGQLADEEQRGLLLTIQGSFNELFSHMPWDTVPFLCYIKQISLVPPKDDTSSQASPTQSNPSSATPSPPRVPRNFYLKIYQNQQLIYQRALVLKQGLLREGKF